MTSISCITWVRKGVAKSLPDKLTLTEEELKNLITNQELRLKSLEMESDADDDEGDMAQEASCSGAVKRKHEDNSENMEPSDDDESDDGEEDLEEEKKEATSADNGVEEDISSKYGLDHYDDESDGNDGEDNPLGLGGLTYYPSSQEDPYLSKDPDSDEENDRIEGDDNLIVVGKMHEDHCNMEVYVYNEGTSSMYCHHDILLPSLPLAVEWCSFDPGADGPANYAVLGTMEPDIEFWDVDVMDAVEPAFVLAGSSKKKGKKKKKTASTGHTGSVLDLSWNPLQPKLLASASADHTVGVWDLSCDQMVISLTDHQATVQAVVWHPYEAQSLLSGSFDRTVKIYDCRSPQTASNSWTLPGEVERVVWDTHDPYRFVASADSGHVYYMDVRKADPVFTLHAHHEAVTGLALSASTPGCLVTGSQDNTYKIWDIRDGKPALVLEKDVKLGHINCISLSPDAGLVFAMGGEREVKVLNLMRVKEVVERFDVGTGVTGDAEALLGAAGIVDDDNQEEHEMMGDVGGGDAPKKKKKKKKKRKKKDSAAPSAE